MTLSKERIGNVIENLEHFSQNLKWTDVRGAQDLLAAAEGLRELLERRERDGQEPVAWRKFVKDEFNSLLDSYEYFEHSGIAGTREPLYAAPIAPVALVNRLDALLNGEEATGNKTDDDIYKDISSLLEDALFLADRKNRPAPSVQWHKVADNPPPAEATNLWVYDIDGAVYFGWEWCGAYFWSDYHDSKNTTITHWAYMTLPAAPQQEVL